jgi:hypothetical protein
VVAAPERNSIRAHAKPNAFKFCLFLENEACVFARPGGLKNAVIIPSRIPALIPARVIPVATPRRFIFTAITAIIALQAAPALVCASSTISETDRYAHAANAGWMDFRPDVTHGVRVDESFLSGHAYSANFGWIHLGDGSPENGHTYSNASPSDYGVNLAPDGALNGYAYSANIGWIAFEQHRGQPRMNYSTGRFSGHAYAANAGWISLETPSSTLVAASIAPPADLDADGIADAWEMQFFNKLSIADSTTDADGDGAGDLQEYLAGTDPGDAASRLRIVSHSHDTGKTTATLDFTTAPNRLYSIQRGDLQGAWTDAGFGSIAPDGAITQRSFVHPAATKLFFRVQAWKPLQN